MRCVKLQARRKVLGQRVAAAAVGADRLDAGGDGLQLRAQRPADAPAAPAAPAAGPFVVDAERHQIRFYGRAMELSRYEYGLLRTLIRRPGRVFTRDELLQQVWDDPGESLDRTVDAHVKTLRAKLKAVAPGIEPIRTHRGSGYALAEDLPPSP